MSGAPKIKYVPPYLGNVCNGMLKVNVCAWLWALGSHSGVCPVIICVFMEWGVTKQK